MDSNSYLNYFYFCPYCGDRVEEWDEFCEQVTAWEVEKYLDRI